jgi:very-short-patch-repair endonuclease
LRGRADLETSYAADVPSRTLGLGLARYMRRNPSVVERRLWKLLRGRKLEGLKFRRQVPIGPYFADFVCLSRRIIVEADGPLHDGEHDAKRDAWLASQGFLVLRFTNTFIEGDPNVVFAAVLAAAEKR